MTANQKLGHTKMLKSELGHFYSKSRLHQMQLSPKANEREESDRKIVEDGQGGEPRLIG